MFTGFSGSGKSTLARAVKGGTLREYILDFPGTLRIDGPESNTVLNSMIMRGRSVASSRPF